MRFGALPDERADFDERADLGALFLIDLCNFHLAKIVGFHKDLFRSLLFPEVPASK